MGTPPRFASAAHARARNTVVLGHRNSPSSPPTTDKPDKLLIELHEAHIALMAAERHIRLWRANSVPGNARNVPISQRLCYTAHEALHEAGQALGRVAETLRIEVKTCLPTNQGDSVQVDIDALSNDAGSCEPACQSPARHS